MMSTLKPHNAGKYYEFHDQSEQTTVEYCELEKSLHELVD